MRAAAGRCAGVGVGTALTLDLLDADGRASRRPHRAVADADARGAARARAAAAGEAAAHYVEFAADTADALASGCEGAALALIERSLDAARDAPGRSAARCCCTAAAPSAGGAAARTRRTSPALVLEGLAIWAGGRIAAT